MSKEKFKESYINYDGSISDEPYQRIIHKRVIDIIDEMIFLDGWD